METLVRTAASDPALPALFLEFGSMLLVLGLLAMLARKWDISAVPFYLVAGLIFGQGGFNVIDQTDTLVPTLAELGVILLLLLLGLEYSGREIVDTARQQSKSGAVDFLANFTPGALLGGSSVGVWPVLSPWVG